MMIGLLLHLMRPAAFSLQFHLSVFTFPAHLCRDFLLCCAKRWTVAFSSLPGGKLQTKRKDTKEKTSVSFGAEGETRTLAPVARPTPLAGAPRHHLSTSPKWQRSFFRYSVLCTSRRFLKWRRRWDSNPRNIAVQRFSRPPP